MAKLFLCTTGTSVAGGVDKTDKQAIQNRIAELTQHAEDQLEAVKAVCAEIKSLSALNASGEDKVVLLHTDTADGQVCAEIVQELVVKAFASEVVLEKIESLQVLDPESFRQGGIPNLFKALDRARNGWQENDVVLNCTGGFKGVVPYIALYGLLNKISTVYIFQFSNSLITLPPLPVSFDYDFLQRALPALEMIDQNTAISEKDLFSNIENFQYAEKDEFLVLVEKVGQNYTMSPFSLMLWETLKQQEGNVFISPNAMEEYNKSTGDVRRMFNAYLDKVKNPLWRKEKRHSFSGTDLEVYKMGSVSERLAGIIHGNEVFVCELFQHDEYERKLAKCQKGNYDLSSFQAFLPEEDLCEEHSLTSYEEMEEAKRKTEATFSDLKSQIEKFKNQLNDKSQQLHRKSQAMDKAQKQIRNLESNLAIEKAKVVKLNEKIKNLEETIQDAESEPVHEQERETPNTDNEQIQKLLRGNQNAEAEIQRLIKQLNQQAQH